MVFSSVHSITLQTESWTCAGLAMFHIYKSSSTITILGMQCLCNIPLLYFDCVFWFSFRILDLTCYYGPPLYPFILSTKGNLQWCVRFGTWYSLLCLVQFPSIFRFIKGLRFWKCSCPVTLLCFLTYFRRNYVKTSKQLGLYNYPPPPPHTHTHTHKKIDKWNKWIVI